MDLVVSGKANKQIAFALGISFKTVETHRARLMSKTGADSIAAIVRIARAAGLDESVATGGSKVEG
jgi:two-component system response regulator DctR/two-component system response regulator FixJ